MLSHKGPKQSQTHKTFAPSDTHTLLSLPDMEVRYRLLRNEWLNLFSRFQQQEEYVYQVERKYARGAVDIGVVQDAKARRAELSTELGILRRLSLIARMKSEAEAFKTVVERLLSKEDRIRVDEMAADLIGRAGPEMRREAGQARTTAEDYALFDRMMSQWDPLGKKDTPEKS